MYKKEVNDISAILSEDYPDLYEKFRLIVSMARSRKEAREAIVHMFEPIIIHLIPYIVMKRLNLKPPSNWVGELNGLLKSIDAKNYTKKGLWFSDTDIKNIFDENLRNPYWEDVVVHKKIEGFKDRYIKNLLKNEINKLFKASISLKLINTDIKHVLMEGKKRLKFFIDGKQL
jgi:hypothetical protein